jgi:hypothetical protein
MEDMRAWSRRRRLLTVALAGCCAAVLTGASATASALTVDLSCAGTASIVFSPPLNGFPTRASVRDGRLTACVSPNGSSAFLKSATITATGLSASGCFPIFSVNGLGTLGWNDGSTSTLSVSLSTNPLGGLAINIRVTAGRMVGDTVTPTPIFVPHGLGCGLDGTRMLDATVASALFTNNRSARDSRKQASRHRVSRLK